MSTNYDKTSFSSFFFCVINHRGISGRRSDKQALKFIGSTWFFLNFQDL